MNQLVGRHVFDPTTGQPLVSYLNAADYRVFLSADERGSVLANTSNAGTLLYGNSYDEFGVRMGWNQYRFQYTGQAWIDEIKLHYYKARMYSAELGRFLQPDPIGYGGGANLYNAMGGDPVNLVDPLGLSGCDGTQPGLDCSPIVITAPEVPIIVTGTNTGHSTSAVVNVAAFGTIGLGDRLANVSRYNRWLTRMRQFARSPGHDYQRRFRITKQETQCTLDDARFAMFNAAVPGRTGNNVSGQTYEVSWFYSHLLTGPDTILFRQTGPNAFENVTLNDHFFRQGSVRGRLSGNQQTGFFFSIHGGGTNVSGVRALENQVFGPEVFKSAARQMNQELLGKCGG